MSDIWRSNKTELMVLKYTNACNGLDVYIGAGFTSPSYGPPAIRINGLKLSGFGYELLVLSTPDTDILGNQLAGWAKYIEDTGCHILQGQYVEYREKICILI